MLRFEKSFNGFESVGNAWTFLELCCKACGVEMENTRAEIEGMPNGKEMLSIYPEQDMEYQRFLKSIEKKFGINQKMKTISKTGIICFPREML